MTDFATSDPIATRLRSHIPALDGIRGIAVLIVIIHHLAQEREVGAGLHRIVLRVCEAGWSGVDLFFVLSGFLITGILLELRGRGDALLVFYARRTLRIFPLYYLSLVLLMFVWPVFSAEPDSFQAMQHNQAWYWTYLTNVLIVLKVPMGQVNAGHFWSLAVEEQFYLVWPFVVLFAPRRRLVPLCVTMVAGALLFRISCYGFGWGSSPAYVLTPSRFDALGMGALGALILRDPSRRRRFAWFVPKVFWAGVVGFVAVVMVQGSFRRGPLMLMIGLTFLAMSFGCLVAASAAGVIPLINRILESRFLRFFGKYSYAMYILHPFVISLLAIFLPEWTGHPGDQVTLIRFFGFAIVNVTVCSLIALISWNTFERWFIGLKKYFETSSEPPALTPSLR